MRTEEQSLRFLQPEYIMQVKVEDEPPLWSGGQSSWLQIQSPNSIPGATFSFLRSSGSRTGSTQPREDN
jgi:hypothetical protein